MEVEGVGPNHTTERHESDIYNIFYSKGGLTILIDTISEDGIRRDLRVHFEYTRGFRYLDEGDLLYYMESDKFKTPQHVFRILTGGWSNGENIQPKTLDVSRAVEVHEWFVGTSNGCINVLSDAEPVVEYI
jgi:hypothetical protein